MSEVHIYRLQPKSATKADFLNIFLMYFCCCCCRFSFSNHLFLSWLNRRRADEVLLGKRPHHVKQATAITTPKTYGKKLQSEKRWVWLSCQNRIGTKEASRCYWENKSNRSKSNMHRLSRTDTESKWQVIIILWRKNHLLLRISAVIGRYVPHLMIVMIFVT